MSAADTLDAATATQVLGEAVQRSQTLDLIRTLDGQNDTCRTRFIEAGDSRLVVAVPSRHGHLVPVRTGEEVEVYFRLGDLRYQFLSTVIDRTEILSDGLALPALILKRPQRLHRRQRRQFFRVSTPLGQRLMAQLWRDPGAGHGRPVALGRFEILDLSAGGLRLLSAKPENAPFSESLSLIIALPLQENEEPLKINALVKHLSRIQNGPLHVGVEFISLDETPAGRSIRNRLQRFVSEREREELRRMNVS